MRDQADTSIIEAFRYYVKCFQRKQISNNLEDIMLLSCDNSTNMSAEIKINCLSAHGTRRGSFPGA